MPIPNQPTLRALRVTKTRPPHLLRASGNVRKLKDNLVNVVDGVAIQSIEDEICANVIQLYALGRTHYFFALRQNNRSWRQKISRLYYAAYNVSRAIRLYVAGEYSTDCSDHKKIEKLPEDFPNKNMYVNRLDVLREDRNLSDYDHTAKRVDLIVEVNDAVALVENFLKDARSHLKQRGLKI